MELDERSSIRDFALAWRDVPSLSKLFLSKNFITDRSLTVMLEHWPLDQSPLKSLQLCHNAIAADGALLLVRAIANHPTLEFLTLDDNKSIGYAGLEMIGNELHTVARLRYFGLKRCATAPPPLPKPREVDEESNVTVPPEILAPTAARDNAATALLRGIEANCSLHHLCISDNGFVPQMEDKVCWYAALNQFGRHLLLAQNRVPATVWCHILAKCYRRGGPRQYDLLYFFIREQPHLLQSMATVTLYSSLISTTILASTCSCVEARMIVKKISRSQRNL